MRCGAENPYKRFYGYALKIAFDTFISMKEAVDVTNDGL
jgi:hypothetical protein